MLVKIDEAVALINAEREAGRAVEERAHAALPVLGTLMEPPEVVHSASENH